MITCSLIDLLKNNASDEDLRAAISQLMPENFGQSEFNSLVDEMKSLADPSFAPLSKIGVNAIDCCGTGGSGMARFNTSTAVAYVLAACDVSVIKSGNRAASGKSGSSDVLEKLGVPLLVNPQAATGQFSKSGLIFLFAPQVYPILGRLGPIRKSLGITTALNFVGPLLNPANPGYRLMGVSNSHMAQLIAGYLVTQAHNRRTAIVTSNCGLDEICPGCATEVIYVEQGKIKKEQAEPVADGICQSKLEGVFDATNNARRIRSLFNGSMTEKTIADIVSVNAGQALHLMDRAGSVEEGIRASLQALKDGKVQQKFEQIEKLDAK